MLSELLSKVKKLNFVHHIMFFFLFLKLSNEKQLLSDYCEPGIVLNVTNFQKNTVGIIVPILQTKKKEKRIRVLALCLKSYK